MDQRPIKLKVWDKELGAFCELLSLSQLDKLHPMLTIVQFTGVCDAKGAEVWEGDILYYRHYDASDNTVYESWHEVVFCNGAFGTLLSADDFQSFSEQTNNERINEVVIGNVFENPQMVCSPRRS